MPDQKKMKHVSDVLVDSMQAMFLRDHEANAYMQRNDNRMPSIKLCLHALDLYMPPDDGTLAILMQLVSRAVHAKVTLGNAHQLGPLMKNMRRLHDLVGEGLRANEKPTPT